MTLNDYLTESGESVTQFAARTGISYHTLYAYLSNRRSYPSLDVYHAINVATQGMVKYSDFLTTEKRAEIEERIKRLSEVSN